MAGKERKALRDIWIGMLSLTGPDENENKHEPARAR